MQRVTSQRVAEAVAFGLSFLPAPILELAEADVFVGDPVFAGLHHYDTTADGRAYNECAHVAFPHQSTDGRTTVVLPGVPRVSTVIHEFGHALDWKLNALSGGRSPDFAPVTEYAKLNRLEAFAEAFTAWFYPPDHHYAFDRASREFFDRLAVGGW